MGNFYTNYTLRGPSQQSVAQALAGRAAIVTPVQDNCVVVFDEESDEQNGEIIAELASRLSAQLHCPLLAVLNHDDDILWYQLYLNGELVDEYNSTPGYFNDSDEETAMAVPEGGDAKKLCAAFEANAIQEVENILRKPSFGGDYNFAFERHEELIGALGLPPFAIGGFRQIDGGGFPEALEESSCIRTEALAAQSHENNVPEPVPGYYKLSFRSNPKKTKSVPVGWMPAKWKELQCEEQTLSDDFRKATAEYRNQVKQLGFSELNFKKLTRILNPNYLDNGGVNYWDGGHRYFGQLIYHKVNLPSLKRANEKVLVVFTAVFEKEILSCTNNIQKEVAPLARHHVVRMDSNDVELLYKTFIEQLQQRAEQPRQFPDVPSLERWFDSHQFELFEEMVRKGFWVRMSDYEVVMARRKLPKP